MALEKKFASEQSQQKEHYGLSDAEISQIINDFPHHHYFEFVHHAWFNGLANLPKPAWQNWNPWEVYHWPIADLVRYKTMLLDNRELIKDKNVASIGSHLGIDTLISLHLGAKQCTGIEPMAEKNKISSFICMQADYENFQFYSAEHRDEWALQKINDCDTLILGSLLDMIPDHYTLIENISKTKIKNIIVEVKEYQEQMFALEPQIKWKVQLIEAPEFDGPYSKTGLGIHGYPNLSFLKMLFDNFGFEFVQQTMFDFYSTNNRDLTKRSVSVWRKS